MKAQKITMSVNIQVLSIDSINSLLMELAGHIRDEDVSGTVVKDDGDSVEWNITSEPVEF